MRIFFDKSLQFFACVIAISVLLILTNAQAAKPSLKGADLLCNGESFFAASNICTELTRLARTDGVLGSSESFKQVAVSGVPIGTVFTQFKNANPKPKFVVTDGGGIDLMSNTCTVDDTNCAMIKQLKTTMQQYITEMKNSGVKAFVWMCYPDPQGSNWATLKKGQDIWAIVAKKVMDATTEPKPLWVDLRTTWAGHYSEYTTDGIHCTTAGGTATATAFWNAMKANNYAFFDTTGSVSTTHKNARFAATPSMVQEQVVSNNYLSLSLSLTHASPVTIRITTVSGRTLLNAIKQNLSSGLAKIQFPLGKIPSGIYCLAVQADRLTNQSTLLVP